MLQVLMQHIAILNRSWKILPKFISGEKTIETRWYINKVAPWGKVTSGDTVYFKDSGKPITHMCTVEHVEQHEFTNPQEMLKILLKYKGELGFSETSYTDLSWLQSKRYGILIFIKDFKEVKPFKTTKKGFGSAAAWLCLKGDISDYIIT